MKTDINFLSYLAQILLQIFRHICRKNRNSHFVLKDFFENRAVYEIRWKNIVEPDRPHMTIWRMPIA
jgi:hypothetical protein